MCSTRSNQNQDFPKRSVSSHRSLRHHQYGFTLIEIIAGLVTLSLSFVILTVIIFPQAQRSAEPVLQVRAAALGKALLDEIMSKAFDEQWYV